MPPPAPPSPLLAGGVATLLAGLSVSGRPALGIGTGPVPSGAISSNLEFVTNIPWFDPIPYAGGKIPGDLFSHNSYRTDALRYRARDLKTRNYRDRRPRPGEVLLATEETFAGDCAADGKLRTVDLKGNLVRGRWDGFDGKGWKAGKGPGHTTCPCWIAGVWKGSRAPRPPPTAPRTTSTTRTDW